MSTLGFLIDDRFLLHNPGPSHPESPNRLIEIQKALDTFGAQRRWYSIEAHPIPASQLESIHSRSHIERVRSTSSAAPGFLDPDTPVCAESYDIALLAAGGVLACVDAIMAGVVDRAFAFVRPPGHHAEPGRAMGFCIFNNVALGAVHLKSQHGLERVAIIDIDVHHGNGTQACFYHDPSVLFISTHQYPFYPGTGQFHDIGIENGWGYTINFPLPAGTGDDTLVPIYSRIVPAMLEQFLPEFILVSAGFDAFQGDPLGGLTVSAAGYGSVAASLCRAADRWCAGRICFVLEGGYSPAGLRECTRAVLAELESDRPRELALPGDPLFDLISEHAHGELGEHWHW
jgi:acetoin utilization deacetylase AcuC-like enzyme